EHALRADTCPHAIDRRVDDVLRGPVARQSCGLHEALEQGRAFRSVPHFRVELQAVDVALPVFHRRDHAGFGRGADGEAGWRFLHAVAMAHPGHELALDTREEAAAVIAQRRLPVLADERAALYATRGDPSAELARYQLHAVADGEDRHAEPEQAFRH